MVTTPPGWYDDGRGALRWWDGAQWTEHVQTPDPEPSDAGDAAHILDAAPEGPPSATAVDVDYAPAAPEGYPGGFPGGADPSGGFISATEPKKSKLWIVWVVVGVVLLGIVVLASVLIPIAIGLFGSIASGGAGGGSSPDDGEAAAIAAVEDYDDAWNTSDCDKFVEATTESFREGLELADCTDFTAASEGFIDSVEDYEITVTSVESTEDHIAVSTVETYTSMFDEAGNPSDVAVPFEDDWTYIVVSSDGGWVIDEALDSTEE